MARYSAEDKQAALDCLADHDSDFKQTSTALGISESTLRKWAREARVQGHELGQLRAGLAALQETIRADAAPDDNGQTRTQRTLLLQLGQDAIWLSESIEEVIDEAPLNQRASALNQILDKYLKLMALLPQRGPQEIHVRFIDPYDGRLTEAPFWATHDFLENQARFKVVACGRRFGKTETGKIDIVLRALQGQRCWWLAPTYATASQVWRDLKAICAPIIGLQVNEAERRLDLPTGGMLAIRSTWHADNLRGAGLDFAVLDEAAFMEPHVWPEVVRPMLLDRAGGALFLSSPKGRNWFWELYQQGQDESQALWRSFHYTSYDNPLLAKADIDAIRASTWDRVFREEYLAEFIDDAGQVFRGILQAATAPLESGPEAGRRYVAGIDWGRQNDYTVIAVIDADRGTMVALDRFNKIGWDLQRGRLVALYKRWRPAVIWAESNSIGEAQVDALQAEGLPVRAFLMTGQSKKPLIEALALAIERGQIALLPDEVLLNELAAYAVARLPSGGFSFNAPSGLHDDTVIATSLAWHGVRRVGSPTLSFA